MTGRKIALFDIDDTIYNGGIIFPLMRAQAEAGLLLPERIQEVEDCRQAYKRGELAYEEQSRNVVISWAEGLRGSSYAQVTNHARDFIKQDEAKFYAYTTELLSFLNPTHDTVIITNEPQFVAEQVLRMFGLNSFSSTVFEVENGLLTGVVSKFNSSQHDKGKSVAEVFEGYEREASLAFGDSISDLQMFEAVEHPICINANEELRAVASVRGWELATPDTVMASVSVALSRP